MSFVSYGHNSEDVLLHRVFGGQETGFYVDLGAYHPVHGSITKSFYDRGWSGINVEPGSVFTELAAARPRDVNLQMAVMDHAGEVEYFENDADRGMSRVVATPAASLTTRKVPCDTLEAVIQAHGQRRPVDFIKIDVEGAEAAIVRSTDWRRVRPQVLLLEATLPWSSTLANQEWEPTLLEQGYVRAYFDGINCYYVPEEDAPALLRHFQVPLNVLDRATPHEFVELAAKAQDQQAEIARLTAERDSLHARVIDEHGRAAQLDAECATLRASLHDQQASAAKLAVEHDTIRAALEDQRFKTTDLARQLGAAEATLQEQRAEAARQTAVQQALQAALQEAQQVGARLTAERDELRETLDRERAAAAQPVSAQALEPVPEDNPAPMEFSAVRQPASRELPRRAALAAYRLVRPVARPIAWRLRGFMVGDVTERLRRLDERVDRLPAQTPDHGVAEQLRYLRERIETLPAPIVHMVDDGARTEMRRLCAEMEKTLLTLALERGPDMWPAEVRSSHKALQDA